ncbi:hypothetical protein GF413_04315 [Candidatus Micrarchaeota archaeon]|nr:hypothetical protein [Candidatus Micrarchaeota archaeon]
METPGGASRKFNYRRAYGKNPWASSSNRLSQWTGTMGASLFGKPSGRSSASSMTQTHVARPRDKAVQDYMGHIMGGTRNLLDNYVRQAAGAGIKRGGMNVVGGPALDSALHHSAIKGLAGSYGANFREAMNYNKYLTSNRYKQQQQNLKNLQSMLGMQERFIDRQAGWANRLGDMQRSDYMDGVNWDRGAKDRAWEEEKRNWARRDRLFKTRARKRDLDEQTARRTEMRRIEALMDGKTGPLRGQMSTSDLNRYGRAMIDEGYWNTLDYAFPKAYSTKKS